MGLAGIFVAVLIGLTLVALMVWGALTALIRAARFVWRFLMQP